MTAFGFETPQPTFPLALRDRIGGGFSDQARAPTSTDDGAQSAGAGTEVRAPRVPGGDQLRHPRWSH